MIIAYIRPDGAEMVEVAPSEAVNAAYLKAEGLARTSCRQGREETDRGAAAPSPISMAVIGAIRFYKSTGRKAAWIAKELRLDLNSVKAVVKG